MAGTIYTVGYEGLDTDGFIAMLQEHGIQCIFDIRDTPWSRKPGFSQDALRENLCFAGIDYVHLPSLGVPKQVRDRYHQDKNWEMFRASYLDAIRARKVSPELRAIASRASARRCALMCFEADFHVCHRSIVAQILQDHLGLQVEHLFASAKNDGQGVLALFE